MKTIGQPKPRYGWWSNQAPPTKDFQPGDLVRCSQPNTGITSDWVGKVIEGNKARTDNTVLIDWGPDRGSSANSADYVELA